MRTDRHTGRWQAKVGSQGKSHHCGRWGSPEAAALARDRCVLFLELDVPLNLPGKAEAAGPASAEQLRREAVAAHRQASGRSQYIGLKPGPRDNWLAEVVFNGELHHVGSHKDPVVLARLRDQFARHLGVPAHSWNFPDEELPALSLSETQMELRRARGHGSAYRGVAPNGSGWAAAITVESEQLNLGTWDTEKDAARAFDRASLFYRGVESGFAANLPEEKLTPTSSEDLQREARLRPREGSRSRYLGVNKTPGPAPGRPWQAVLTRDRAPLFLGAWTSEREAAIKVDQGMRYYFEVSEWHLNVPEVVDEYPPLDAAELRREAHAGYKETTTSQYRGVHFRAGRFDAKIMHDGEVHWLGRHDTEEEAAEVYDKAARRLHGEEAKLNFTED